MKAFAILLMLLPAIAFAHHPVPEPTPTPVPTPVVSSHSNFNGILLGALIVATGVCIYHECWKEKKEFSVKSQPGDDR